VVLAIVHGLIFAARVVLDVRSSERLKCDVLVINIVIFLFMLSLRVNRRSRVVRNIQL